MVCVWPCMIWGNSPLVQMQEPVMNPVLNHTQGKCHAYVMTALSSHQPSMGDISIDEEVRETRHDGSPNTKTIAPFLTTSRSRVLRQTGDIKVHSRREDDFKCGTRWRRYRRSVLFGYDDSKHNYKQKEKKRWGYTWWFFPPWDRKWLWDLGEV